MITHVHRDLPLIHLARHGETEWSRSGQHTGRTDLPLTETGIAAARALGRRLSDIQVSAVLTSPLARARLTCELAGFKDRAELESDLLEWDYGNYEGRRTAEILRERPGWDLFRDGSPGGESTTDITLRVDRLIARLQSFGAPVLLFSSG